MDMIRHMQENRNISFSDKLKQRDQNRLYIGNNSKFNLQNKDDFSVREVIK